MAKPKPQTYSEALEYLYGLQKYGIKFGLNKTANLLKAFGNPHRGQRYVHIGGTNGKGSVAAMLESVFMESGLKVALYSSPHLVRFAERFRINRQEITPKEVTSLTREIRAVIGPEPPPTFFEVATTMALVYFAREECDLAIMEVGMGGRLDATNVIRPMVSVITNISLDHQAYLGRRVLEIAGEKAGIIKRGVDLITAATQPSVLRLFQSVCDAKKAALWRVGRDVRYRKGSAGLDYRGLDRRFGNLELGLRGDFQRRNAATALAVLEVLDRKGLRVSERDITEGLKHPYWPGRVHVISHNPLIVLDGGHNPAAVRVLADSVGREFRYKKLILVLGIMKDKDIAGVVRAIVPKADYVIYSRPAYDRAAAPEEIRQKARSFGKPGEVLSPLKDAIERAKTIAGSEDMILICGSLFTVGEAMTRLAPERYRPDELRW
jgi:dihydrofolate synthase / folylpolyglutamate synthase